MTWSEETYNAEWFANWLTWCIKFSKLVEMNPFSKVLLIFDYLSYLECLV